MDCSFSDMKNKNTEQHQERANKKKTPTSISTNNSKKKEPTKTLKRERELNKSYDTQCTSCLPLITFSSQKPSSQLPQHQRGFRKTFTLL
jgi:hypothetical protein